MNMSIDLNHQNADGNPIFPNARLATGEGDIMKDTSVSVSAITTAHKQKKL